MLLKFSFIGKNVDHVYNERPTCHLMPKLANDCDVMNKSGINH